MLVNNYCLLSSSASFYPPDLPTDDTSNPPMELDEDELEWQKWLADLMTLPSSSKHSSVSEDEQEDDTEYNYSADKAVLEKEEFRNDRAVKIPRELMYASCEYVHVQFKLFMVLQFTKHNPVFIFISFRKGS